MKNTIILFSILAFTVQFSSQAQTTGREIGIKALNFNDFTFLFKKQTADTKYRRYSVFFSSNAFFGSNSGYQAQLIGSIGFERRKYISDKVEFIRGFNPGINLGFSAQSNSDISLFGGVSLGYILGFQYHINEEFILGAEMIPTISARSSFDENPIININSRISQSAGLFLIYKFNKK